MRFYVQDWAGNLMNFGPFETFEDAWDFIRDRFPNEEDWQEYEVFEKGEREVRESRYLDPRDPRAGMRAV